MKTLEIISENCSGVSDKNIQRDKKNCFVLRMECPRWYVWRNLSRSLINETRFYWFMSRASSTFHLLQFIQFKNSQSAFESTFNMLSIDDQLIKIFFILNEIEILILGWLIECHFATAKISRAEFIILKFQLICVLVKYAKLSLRAVLHHLH